MGVEPLFRHFRPPEGMENDPAYSPQARRGFKAAQDEGFAIDEDRRLREMRAAEDRAIQSIRDNPDEIPNVFARNPELVRSPSFGQFESIRQSVIPTRAQQTLAPSLRMKLAPDEAQYFDEEIGVDGDAVGAFQRSRMRGARERDYADLVDKNVPWEVVDAYKQQGKVFSPMEKAQLIQRHKKASAVDDADEVGFNSYWSMIKESPPLKPDGSMDYEQLKNLHKQGRLMFNYDKTPPPADTSQAAPKSGAVAIPAAVEKPAPVDYSATHYSELPQQIQRDAGNTAIQPSQEKQRAADLWTQAKGDLEQEITSLVPDAPFPGTSINQLDRLAQAIVDNEMVNQTEEVLPEYRSLVVNGRVPPWVPLLSKLKRSGVAFKEPGNLRTGTQQVTMPELAKAWAEDRDAKRLAREEANARAAALPPEDKAKAAAAWADLVGTPPPKALQ